MSDFTLSTIDIKGLNTFSNPRDILRDLFVYLDYVSQHSIKRMTRTNEIPRSEQQRMAKIMGDLTFNPGEGEIDASQWIEFIDRLAYSMDLVYYDIKGEYRGASSMEPSFVDNYISVKDGPLNKFTGLDPVEQEKRILKALKTPKSFESYRIQGPNEFFETSVLGELDSFDGWGMATGVMPTLSFSEIRQFLLDLLVQCTPGVWYSTESFVQYLKLHHPYFLISQKIQPDRYGHTVGRYDNFHEHEGPQDYERKTVPVDAPDAFERVEGRYVERFFENIPLIMRFVDVAYDPRPYQGVLPSRGRLKAFRVSERFQRLMSGEKVSARVTVQPNFEVVIESDFYPAKIVRQVAALGEQISSPANASAFVGIFQLKKASVAAEMVRQPSLDVVALLKALGGRDLPANVQTELEEWSGHADQFVLYEGFALLEHADELPPLDKYSEECLSPNLLLVRNAGALYQHLEEEHCVPLRVGHFLETFYPLTEPVISVFPKETGEEAQETVTSIKVKHTVSVTTQFPDEDSFDAFRKMLAELRCPFQSDSKLRTITFDQKNQARFDQAVQRLADIYAVEIE